MLDACWGAAAELQKEDFDRQIFQHLREEAPDVSNHPVSASPSVLPSVLLLILSHVSRCIIHTSRSEFKDKGVNIFPSVCFQLLTCRHVETQALLCTCGH